MAFGTENTVAVGERGKGSRDGEGFTDANRESAARRNRTMTLTVPSSSSCAQIEHCRQLVAFRLHFQFIIPALFSNIPPSWRKYLRLPKRVVPCLYFKTVTPIFCLFHGGWVVVVSRVSDKSQSSIVLLAIENVRPLAVDDGQCWVSLEGRVHGWPVWLFLILLVLSIPLSKLQIVIPVL